MKELFEIVEIILVLSVMLYLAISLAGYLLCFLVYQFYLKKRKLKKAEYEESASPLNSKWHGIVVFLNAFIRYKCFQVGKFNFLSTRLFLYKHFFGIRVGKDSVIYKGANIRAPWNLIIGNNSIIGSNAKLDGRGGLIIGNNVNISDEVNIWSGQHDPQDPDFNRFRATVIIEDYAWISNRAIILPGVKIAKGTVVAAGAIVTKSTTPYSIYAGIPAKKVGDRNQDLKYNFHPSKDYAPFY